MPNNLFQAEISEPVARQGTQVFVHIALLPREEGEELCAISQRLASQVPKDDAFYVLPMAKAPSGWTQIIEALLTGNPPVMPKAVSYPHVTLLHIWMEQHRVEALFSPLAWRRGSITTSFGRGPMLKSNGNACPSELQADTGPEMANRPA